MKFEKDFWLSIRQALLMLLDAVERALDISPTTAAIRRQWKKTRHKE